MRLRYEGRGREPAAQSCLERPGILAAILPRQRLG
jgi:hypothetical protein